MSETITTAINVVECAETAVTGNWSGAAATILENPDPVWAFGAVADHMRAVGDTHDDVVRLAKAVIRRATSKGRL
jgi:hypothetical protein